MTTDLNDYEAAFERVERSLQLRRDWGLTEARVRRRLKRPTWALVKTVIIILVCIGCGLAGVLNGWMVAAGLVLAILPRQISKLRARTRELAEVETAEDVRALCAREASGAASEAMLGGLVMGLLGLTFLLTAFVAWLLGKSPVPGLLAGLLTLAWGAVKILVLFPPAQREASLLDDDDDEDEDDEDV